MSGKTGSKSLGGSARRVTEWTPARHRASINKLSLLSLKELRRRQALNDAHIRSAMEQLAVNPGPVIRERLEKSLEALRIMETHYTEAILKKEFGD